MKISYPIADFFDGWSILDYFKWFHLGKSKMLEIQNQLYLNGVGASLHSILKTNDLLEIDYLEELDFIPDRKKIDIVYEDDYFLLVNKPSGILVHPDDKSKRDTMCNIVRAYYEKKGINLSIKYAHRLDMDTTGILIFVKDALVHAKIDEMIAYHTFQRNYLCLVSGHMSQKTGWIDAPIGMDRHHQQRRRLSKTGKSAQTYYEVVREYKNYSLLKVRLKTGRTHQIRVHMSSIGHPLLGDELYGGRLKYPRVMLHSYEVDFIHPVTLERIHICQEPPFDMKKWID